MSVHLLTSLCLRAWPASWDARCHLLRIARSRQWSVVHRRCLFWCEQRQVTCRDWGILENVPMYRGRCCLASKCTDAVAYLPPCRFCYGTGSGALLALTVVAVPALYNVWRLHCKNTLFFFIVTLYISIVMIKYKRDTVLVLVYWHRGRGGQRRGKSFGFMQTETLQ